MELKIEEKTFDQAIKDQLKVQLAAVLAKQSDYLITRLVDHVLTAKKDSYDRETILDKAIADMIRDEAQAGIREWLDTKRADIRKQVHAALAKKSDGLVAKIVEQLVLSMQNLDVRAYLSKGTD